ncbi:MAG: hypothetical protein WC693_05735 [Patescibacteria group bacterium]|jgi:hypothetical protein
MIIIRRISSIFSLLAVLALFEILVFNPNWFLYIILILEAIVVISIIGLAWKKIELKEIWQFLIPPVFLIASAYIFIFFVEGVISTQLFIFFVVFLYGVFIENTFLYLYQPVKYQPYALENISAYVNLVSVFFMGASFHSNMVFFGTSGAMSALFVLIFTYVLVIQMIWINKIVLKGNYTVAGMLALLVAEIFWATVFLPSSYLVNGIIIALSYYFLVGIFRYWLLKSLDRKVFKRYIIISVSVFIVVALSARWT